MNRDQILEVLEKNRQSVFQYDSENGSTLIACRRGARIIGLFPCREGRSDSALWINPNLDAILGGSVPDWSELGAGGMGGDRIWIAPERNFYYENPDRFENWTAPLDMDPGEYEIVEQTDDSIVYRNTFDLEDRLKSRTYPGVVLERSIRSRLLDSLKGASGEDLRDKVRYIAVDVENRLEIAALPDNAPTLALWELAQVTPPIGGSGTVLIPTVRKSNPVPYFGQVPESHLRVHKDHVSFRIDAREVHKIGIEPQDLPASGLAKIGFLKPVTEKEPGSQSPPRPVKALGEPAWLFVLRESQDVPRRGDQAVDPAKSDPDGRRGVIQSYNCGPDPADAKSWPGFGELEMQYQPAVRDEKSGLRSTARSRLIACNGPQSAIFDLAAAILGVPQPDLFG